MDHSPSEQLSGEPSHTTVLVASPGIEHSELARDVAAKLRTHQGVLSKWKKGTRAYRRHFWHEFTRHFAKYPVYVFAVSASEAVIRARAPRLVGRFGLGRHYRNTGMPADNPIIEIGPLVNARTWEEVALKVSENRALTCLHIGGFVLGIQRAMYAAANSDLDKLGGHINWNFLADKLPGDLGGDMETMFCALLGHQRHMGRLCWGAFKNSDRVETDLLADNLAGVLNKNTRSERRDAMCAELPGGADGGFLYWVVAV